MEAGFELKVCIIVKNGSEIPSPPTCSVCLPPGPLPPATPHFLSSLNPLNPSSAPGARGLMVEGEGPTSAPLGPAPEPRGGQGAPHLRHTSPVPGRLIPVGVSAWSAFNGYL